jgi:hypothetical protein
MKKVICLTPTPRVLSRFLYGISSPKLSLPQIDCVRVHLFSEFRIGES